MKKKLLLLVFGSTLACSPAPGAEVARAGGPLIGGHAALESEFPSTVYLGCTAAKVGPRHLLLAAHCVHDTLANTVSAYYQADGILSFTVDNDGSLPGWLEIPIEETHIFSEWTAACGDGCEAVWAFEQPHPPDVALIVLEQETPTIPIARIDAKPVAIGDQVVLTGYGCEEYYGGPSPNPNRFKLETATVIGGDDLDHENTIIAPEDIPALLESYLLTPGPSLDETSAGLCPGDSGGPTYRPSSSEQLVVGVNAYYTFPVDSGVPMTNWHTRLDENANFPVLSWLEGLGALVRRDGMTPEPRGGARWPIPGTVQAEDYDDGGEGVGYHDSDPSNLPNGQYRNEGVDIEASSDDGGGFNVGSATADEWLHYSLVAEAEGLYQIELRVAAAGADLTLGLELDGEALPLPIAVANTGDLQVFQTVMGPAELISPGNHELRLLSQTGGVNVNWLRFTLLPPSCTDTLLNGTESDLDCGAACPTKCPTGKTCGTALDCQSQNCVNGSCQDAPIGGAGGSGGSGGASGGSAGAMMPPAGMTGGSGGAGATSAGASAVPAPKPAAHSDSGCGCRLPSQKAPSPAGTLLLGLFAAAALRRRFRL